MLIWFSLCCRRHLGLLILQFRADLRGLSGPIAQRDVQLDAHALVWSGGVDQLVHGAAVADDWDRRVAQPKSCNWVVRFEHRL